MIVWLWLIPLCWGIPLQTQRSTIHLPVQGVHSVAVAPQVRELDGSSQQVLHLRPDSNSDSNLRELFPPPSTPTPEQENRGKPSHGAFLTTTTPSNQDTNPYVRTLRKAQFPTTLIDRYAHELVALGLLLLVPVTLGVVELAERIGHYYCEEEFPDRGRERNRCFGRERRLRRAMREGREKRVYEERRWWGRT